MGALQQNNGTHGAPGRNTKATPGHQCWIMACVANVAVQVSDVLSRSKEKLPNIKVKVLTVLFLVSTHRRSVLPWLIAV